MSLGSERRRFARMKTLLCLYIDYLGHDYAEDQGKRCTDCPVGHPKSTHRVGLAIDILIYTPHGSYPHPSADAIYSALHDFWDFLGGAERINGDLNHFSLPWKGVR